MIDEAKKRGNISEVAKENKVIYRVLRRWMDDEDRLRAAAKAKPVVSSDVVDPDVRRPAVTGFYRNVRDESDELRRLREEILERDRLIVRLTLQNAKLSKGD